jgi:tRNA U34 5-methylaminomethyl-2-thiouridine-forming methyltransferase MnmC
MVRCKYKGCDNYISFVYIFKQDKCLVMEDLQKFTPVLTDDGSFTFFSPQFGEHFHSNFGAFQEAMGKFVFPTQLDQKAVNSDVFLLDVCYGLGYNSAAAMATIWAVNPVCHIHLIGLELDDSVPKAAIAHNLLYHWSNDLQEILRLLATNNQVILPNLRAELLLGDARQTIQKVVDYGFLADAIFLDPFSPRVCPQLWTVEFLNLVVKCLKKDGILATYSCAAAIRTALLLAGVNVGRSEPVGRRSPGTLAGFGQMPLLSLIEQEHLQTKAAIPYRDPSLKDSAEVILQRREEAQKLSDLESTSRWKKRWISSGKIEAD